MAPTDGPTTDPWRGRPADQPADELFASRVPTESEPVPGPTSPQFVPFDPTETTPIFEEIASAWFRSNRPVPVEYGSARVERAPDPAPVVAPAPVPTHAPVAPAPPLPKRTPAAGRPAPAEPAIPDRVAAAVTPDHGFASLADEGWRAARGMTTTRGDELTSAGLPKRRPRARLVPGSAGSAVLTPLATPTRSAETIRGRLASYQQGVRLGRESRLRGDTESTPGPDGGTEQANAHGNHDEESS